jgi:uncharacterized protein YciI
MQFVVYAKDSDGALPLRMQHRPEHLAGLKKLRLRGNLVDAGAILDEAGQMAGSIVTFEVADRAELDAILAEEVFRREGVWGEILIIPFRRANLD